LFMGFLSNLRTFQDSLRPLSKEELRPEAQIAHENNEFNPLSQVLIMTYSLKK
jgi:hypothetical protein